MTVKTGSLGVAAFSSAWASTPFLPQWENYDEKAIYVEAAGVREALDVEHSHGTAVPDIHTSVGNAIPLQGGRVEMERGRWPVQGPANLFFFSPS